MQLSFTILNYHFTHCFLHWITQSKHDFPSHFYSQAKVGEGVWNVLLFVFPFIQFCVYDIFMKPLGFLSNSTRFLKKWEMGKAITSRHISYIIFQGEFLYIFIHNHYLSLGIKKIVYFYSKHGNIQEKKTVLH